MDHRRLAERVRIDHGVVSPAALEELGISDRQRLRRLASGEWRRLPCGVVVLSAFAETFETRATAALTAMPEGVLSHSSAARAHDRDIDDERMHLTTRPGGRTRLGGVVVHRSSLEPMDVTVRHGFRVTTIERTLIDLGAILGTAPLRRCIEDALVDRVTTFDRLEDTFIRRARAGRGGIARARTVLGAIDGQPPNESELEAMFERLLLRAALPMPERQVHLPWLEPEKGRVDCWYPGPRLVVELDGRRFHERSDAFERDRRRGQMALMAGVRTVRFTHRQVRDRPAEVAEVLRALLDPS
jgi:very-short-patch-repair endonuclease